MTIRFRLLAFLLSLQLCFTLLFLSLFYFKGGIDFVVIGMAILILLLSIIAFYFIASKIVEPLKALKSGALNLAAGDYEEKIEAKGAKEIVELAHTLNTLRECLLDHVNRLQESSYMREKIYGEQECTQILFSRMVDGVIERFEDPRLMIKHLTAGMVGGGLGLKLLLNAKDPWINLSVLESEEEGFESLYLLATGQSATFKKVDVKINFQTFKLHVAYDPSFLPLLWSSEASKFQPDFNAEIHFNWGDYLFLLTGQPSFLANYKLSLREAMSKVLRQFAYESFDLLTAMLTSELNFLLKKGNVTETIHIFCLKFQNEIL